MEFVLFGLGAVAGIGGLICFILVVIEMFKRQQQTMGIVAIVGLFVCGIGYIVALIFGWMKAKEWDISKLMSVYTACFIASFVFNGAGYAVFIPKMMNEIQTEMETNDMNQN